MKRSTRKPESIQPVSKPSAVAVAGPSESSDDMWARISRTAYELWEQRGRPEGDALQDWLDAEAMVRDSNEARQ